MRVRYRVDGILHDATTVPRRMVAGVTSRLKIMASLDIAEQRLPQDGRVGLNVGGHPVDIRMASCPSVRGEKIVLRILDKEQALIGLDRLGMQDDTMDRFRTGFTRSYGATFVTGRPARARRPASTPRSTRSTRPRRTSSRSRTRSSTSSPA